MTNSTMDRKINFKKVAIHISIAIFWLLVWQVSAVLVNLRLDNGYALLPTPFLTIKALFSLMGKARFYKVVLYSLIRVVSGVFLGVIGGVLLAIASHYYPLLKKTLTPVISIVKATPVVTFIVLLWISMSGNALTVFIAFLMVMPIMWQNILDGYDAVPEELNEVATVFEFSRLKRFKAVTLPCLLRFFFPALITSIGLAWKAEIAAEIIAYTKVSIGQYIYDAKINLYNDQVFAWIIVIAGFSILLEFVAKRLIRRYKNEH